MSSVRIIGVGNPLMADDGLGIAAVERLAALRLPPGVEVIDGGTGGLTLLTLMEGAGRVILIDAVAMGRPPGAIVRFTPEEVEMDKGAVGFSLHETGLASVFALGRELGTLPPVVIYGVEPETVERRIGLSPVIEEALAPLTKRLLGELRGEVPTHS